MKYRVEYYDPKEIPAMINAAGADNPGDMAVLCNILQNAGLQILNIWKVTETLLPERTKQVFLDGKIPRNRGL